MTTAATAKLATSKATKFIRMGLSLFRKTFNSSKCKTAAKMAVARIKLLRNKREVVVKQMRRDIALLLQSGQDATARIRVEHVIREQNILAANEIIELFCELVVSRLSIIAKQRECPADLKEGIASLIFAAPRCSEIPELAAIRDVFEKKYGKDFVSAATDLRPSCGVNRLLVDKLSVRHPTGEVKLKIMKEIAKEFQIDWDTTESEKELLKPPEELVDGPRGFVSLTSLPVKPTPNQSVEMKSTTNRLSDPGERGAMQFHDTASAAGAAAELAKQAIAAAQAAAVLADKKNAQFANSGYGDNSGISNINLGPGAPSYNQTGRAMPSEPSWGSTHQSNVSERFHEPQGFDRSHRMSNEEPRPVHMDSANTHRRHSCNANFAPSGGKFNADYFEERSPDHIDRRQEVCRRHSYNNGPHSDIKFDESDCNEKAEPIHMEGRKDYRRHTYNAPSAHSDIKFDESDDEEDTDVEDVPTSDLPPARPPPPLPSFQNKQNSFPRVHPKLPDYDDLAARFESLKYRK